MISSYPKIFTIGTDFIKDIFKEEVEVTEKVDGSQFGFGKIDGTLFMRSKSSQLFPEMKLGHMFGHAIDYVESIYDKLPDGIVFYGEYMRGPRHNTLRYNRIPQNHIMLFGAQNIDKSFYENIDAFADALKLERAPVLFKGKVDNPEDLIKLMDTESFLGGTKIEGIVVKNYHRQFFLGDFPIPIMAGKFVSEKFKERNKERWGKEEVGKNKIHEFFSEFRTEARWMKAIQHLRDSGDLEKSPRDIGKLLKEIYNDIESEEKETIKTFLWNEHKDEVKRTATKGFPEWYKEYLLKGVE